MFERAERSETLWIRTSDSKVGEREAQTHECRVISKRWIKPLPAPDFCGKPKREKIRTPPGFVLLLFIPDGRKP